MSVAVPELELEDELSRALGCAVTVVGRRPAEYSSSHELEEIVVRRADGTRTRLIRKDLAPGRLLPAAADAKPAYLVDPRREIWAYREVVDPLGLDAPRLLGSVLDEGSGRYWLLLEPVEGVPLWQVGDLSAWRAVSAWLATLHRRPARACEGTGLLVRDRRLSRVFLDRAVAAAPPGALDPIRSRHDRICRGVERWPSGLLHGEFYPSNVLIGDGGDRIWALDWEMAGHGSGALDLAALTSGSGWGNAEREELVDAYHAAWRAGGGKESRDDLRDALICARIQIALQWIGWSRRWKPPSEQSHDWLGDALTAVEEL